MFAFSAYIYSTRNFGFFGWGFAGRITMLSSRVAGRMLGLRGPDLTCGPEVAHPWIIPTRQYIIILLGRSEKRSYVPSTSNKQCLFWSQCHLLTYHISYFVICPPLWDLLMCYSGWPRSPWRAAVADRDGSQHWHHKQCGRDIERCRK